MDETPFNLVDLMNADEVIMSASGWIYTIITEIDGIPVGGKAPELAKKLRDAVYNEFEEYTSK